VQGQKTQARKILQQWLSRHPEHSEARSLLEQVSP